MPPHLLLPALPTARAPAAVHDGNYDDSIFLDSVIDTERETMDQKAPRIFIYYLAGQWHFCDRGKGRINPGQTTIFSNSKLANLTKVFTSFMARFIRIKSKE